MRDLRADVEDESLRAVVLADVEAECIVFPPLHEVIVVRRHLKAGALVVMGVIVLRDGVDDAAIDVEAAAVKPTRAISVGFVVLNGYFGRIRRPNSTRPRLVVAVRAIVVSHIVFNRKISPIARP